MSGKAWKEGEAEARKEAALKNGKKFGRPLLNKPKKYISRSINLTKEEWAKFDYISAGYTRSKYLIKEFELDKPIEKKSPVKAKKSKTVKDQNTVKETSDKK